MPGQFHPRCGLVPKREDSVEKPLKEEISVTIRPLYDRVVLRRVEAETTTRGGIIIPDSAAEKSNQGEVVAIGPGAVLENGATRPLAVAPGDRVLFNKYAATEQKIDGEELLVVRESDIIAVIEQQPAVEKAA
jgi:chaperonin GroES